MKKCNCCQLEKSIDQFYIDRGRPATKCKDCVREKVKKWNSENIERKAESSKKWYAQNKDLAIARAATWKKENPEAVRASHKKHRATADRSKEIALSIAVQKEKRRQSPDEVRAKERAWYALNKERVAAMKLSRRRANPEPSINAQRKYRATDKGRAMQNERKHERRARLLQAIPSWADRDAIADMFKLARALSRGGVKFSVDHIYPLKGKSVCGLHVFENLQVIPLLENIRKHARLPEAAEGDHHR